MQYVKQDFFDQFVCSADKCPDNCCHEGWQIVVDDDTLDRFKNYEGPLKEKIIKGVDFEEGLIKFGCDGKCTMLREDGLCEMVLEMGEESLCDTCHLYPRHVEEFDGIREWSISVSCPLVAKMTIEKEEEATFVEYSDDLPDPLEDDFDDFDYILFDRLEESRPKIYKVLTDSELSIEDRIAIVIDYSERLQECLDKDSLFEMDEIIPLISITESDKFSVFEFAKNHGRVFKMLERLRKDWDEYLGYFEDAMMLSEQEFSNRYSKYVESYGKAKHDKMLENLLMSLIFTYYLGAVYDDMIKSKIMLTVFIAVMIDVITFGASLSGKIADIELFEEVTYKLAREIEHSDENLNLIEEYFA